MAKRGPISPNLCHVPQIIELYLDKEMSMKKISKWFKRRGVRISDTVISNLLRDAGIKARGYNRGKQYQFKYRDKLITIRGQYDAESFIGTMDRYDAGESPYLLSNELEIPLSTIEKWAVQAGINRSPRDATINARINKGEISGHYLARKCAEIYNDNHTLTMTAEALGITTAAVHAHLKALGVKTRSRGEGILIRRYGSLENHKAWIRKICKMTHVDKMTQAAIARELNIAPLTVKNALKSEHNPYRVTPNDHIPWHLQLTQKEEELGSFSKALNAIMLEWTPVPQKNRTPGVDPVRGTTRILFSSQASQF